MLPQPKEATKKAPKKVGQVKKKCLDGRKGANKRHQWEFVTQDPCSIDLSVLQSHQAPSPILVIDLSVLLFHHAPSPISDIHLSVLLFHHAPSPLLSIPPRGCATKMDNSSDKDVKVIGLKQAIPPPAGPFQILDVGLPS